MLPASMNITTAAAPCVSIEEFAAHANLPVVPDSEAELIAAYIAAAEDAVCRELKRPLGVCTVEFRFAGAFADNMEISYTPLISVASVTVNGETVASSIDRSGAFPKVKITSTPAADAEIVITAQVGWVTVPQALRVAVMMLAAGYYEHRMDQAEHTLTDVAGFSRLLAAYKQEFAY